MDSFQILVRCLKADPDVRHPVTGRTAIHYASQRNYLDVVRYVTHIIIISWHLICRSSKLLLL